MSNLILRGMVSQAKEQHLGAALASFKHIHESE